MCSVSAGRPAFFNRPDSCVVFSWESLQDVVRHQRAYVQSSFDWVQTSSGTQWKSSLPEKERKRRFAASGIAGLSVTVGRDAAFFLAYGTRFEFSECGLAEAIARAECIRPEKIANMGRYVRSSPRRQLRIASQMLTILMPCDWCGGLFLPGCKGRPRKCCSWQCVKMKDRKASRDYQRMLKVEKRDVVLKNRKKYRERVRSCPKRRLRASLSAYIRKFMYKRGTSKSRSTMKYVGCSLDLLASHLESLFQPGMSWQNRDQWHVDHIYPLRAIDPRDEFELHGVCNWRNLRPMWAIDNERKQGSVTPETTMAFMELCKLVANERHCGKAGKMRGRGKLRPRLAS